MTLAALELPAAAHFKLNSPASLSNQNTLGDPQKSDPCGQDDPNFVLTNEVTTVAPGSTLTISIEETIGHEGHFRVALASSMQMLPANPPVTPGGGDPCDATVIDPNPVPPILGDGLLPHVNRLQGVQTMTVTLPNAECPNCVLQVIQYMRNHSAPCFYHHCATLNVSNSAPPPVDGAPTGDDAGVDPVGGEVGGGCCNSTREAPGTFVVALLVIGLLVRRRR
jgi:uncharacterized protein (TIGR03382 family)